MMGFHHILFPVDFSDRCRAVRPYVQAMAQMFDSKITLMHVMQIPQGIYGGVDASYPIVLDMETMERDAEEMLGNFFETPMANVEALVESGDAAVEVVRFAEVNNVDLVMMPTHGYGKFRSLLLGSVTAKALHDLACPVWTSAHSEATPPDHTAYQSILCALDLRPCSLEILQHAVSFASHFRAELRIVHAVPGAEFSDPRFDLDFSNFLLQTAREEIVKLQHKAGTNLEVCVAAGTVSKVVHQAALQHDADLAIIGRGRIHGTLGRLRTNSYAIIRESPCPVLSF